MADSSTPPSPPPPSAAGAKGSWAAKSLRSGFGEQPTSNRPSAPAAGFGSSSRDAYAKQYASAEADRAQARASGGSANNLGACYNIPVGVPSCCWGSKAVAAVWRQPTSAATPDTVRVCRTSRCLAPLPRLRK